MSVSPDRAAIAAGHAEVNRIPLAADSPARIAGATAPTVTRFAAAAIEMALEIEPASFVVVQQRGSGL